MSAMRRLLQTFSKSKVHTVMEIKYTLMDGKYVIGTMLHPEYMCNVDIKGEPGF